MLLVEISNPRDFGHPRYIGKYKVERRHSEGGCGIVYLATTPDGKNRVAIKVLKRSVKDPQMAARFRRERRLLAQIEHENIAHSIDSGETKDGRPFVVMEFIDGLSLTEYSDRHRLSINERLELFLQVCAAVEYAHTQGVVHRDLKPANVLVTGDRDRARVVVVDFGLAKCIDVAEQNETTITLQGQVFGTARYMSPEQAGGSAKLDERTDVYSLGALMHELLVGVDNHSGQGLEGLQSVMKVLEAIRSHEPVHPLDQFRALNVHLQKDIARCRRTTPKSMMRALGGDLGSIVIRTLAKRREERYARVQQLALDIRLYLRGNPISSHPRWLLRRLGRRAAEPYDVHQGCADRSPRHPCVSLAGRIEAVPAAGAAREPRGRSSYERVFRANE